MFVAGRSAVTSAYVRTMSGYLAKPDSEWPSTPPERDDATFAETPLANEGVPARITELGDVVNLALADVDGPADHPEGDVAEPGQGRLRGDPGRPEVLQNRCSRGVRAQGGLLVPPGAPTKPVAVRLVLDNGLPVVDRFAAGSVVQRHLQP